MHPKICLIFYVFYIKLQISLIIPLSALACISLARAQYFESFFSFEAKFKDNKIYKSQVYHLMFQQMNTPVITQTPVNMWKINRHSRKFLYAPSVSQFPPLPTPHSQHPLL